MTEGMEHLVSTYRNAGINIASPGLTGPPRGWGFRDGTGSAVLVYKLLSEVDPHGRVLAQRWASRLDGQVIVAPGSLPTMVKVSRFDRITQGDMLA